MNLEILLCRIKSKENVGSIYRLAHQFDCKRIYIYQCAQPGRTNTYKAERHIPIEQVESLDFLNELVSTTVALETGGIIGNLRILAPFDSLLIAVGNESHGFTKDELEYFDHIYSLNSKLHSSYNVSHALAIGLYNIYFRS